MNHEFSQLELISKGPLSGAHKNYVVQKTSFEEDISVGIHDAREESKSEGDEDTGGLTFLQFKLNDGRVLTTSVNLDTTKVLALKKKVFPKDLEEGKAVRLLFMGKMLNDEDYLSKYKLVNMSFIHALISKPLVRPEGAKPSDGMIETTDGKVGFDRFLRLRNKQYTDLQVHNMRLAFHSIMMRSGVEKTDETADGLLTNEEKWMKNELENDESLLRLMNRKTVLSCRNDIVLPRHYMEPESVINNTKSDGCLVFLLFLILGSLFPVVSLL